MANSIYKNRILSHNTDLNQIIQTIGNLPPAGTEDITAELDAFSAAVDSHVSMLGRKVAENNGAGEFVWKRSEIISIGNVTLSFTQNATNPTIFTVSSDDIDLSTVNGEFFSGVTINRNSTTLTTTFVFESNGIVNVNGTGATYTYDPSTHKITTTYNMISNVTWKDYTIENFEEFVFLDYVVSSSEDTYPDGAEQDGYWYEKVIDGTEYGILFKNVDSNGYPTDLVYNVPCVTSFGNTKTFLDSITKNALTVELDCQNTAIAQNGLENAFTDFGGKLKLKNVPSIGNSGLKGFQMDATSGKRAVYIPVSCTTVGGASSTSGCFYAANASTKIYCGATSTPSGFGTYWNSINSSTRLSTTWGVTEEQFDAL